MALVVASLFGFVVPRDGRFSVLVVLAFGAAISAAFLGGVAAAQGNIPIPGAEQNALAVSATGGIGVLLVVLLLGYYLYVRPGNERLDNQVVLPVPRDIPKEFSIDNLTPEAIADVGEVRTNGGKRYLYVEFFPGKTAGRIQLTYLPVSNTNFQKLIFDVSVDSQMTRTALQD